MFKIAYINFHSTLLRNFILSNPLSSSHSCKDAKSQLFNFLLVWGQPSFSRILKPIEQAPISLSLEEVTVRAGHKVLMEVDDIIMKQVALNDLSLLLQIQMQNTQTLQLFTNIIKTESIYISFKNAQKEAWVQRPSGLIKMSKEVRVLQRKET